MKTFHVEDKIVENILEIILEKIDVSAMYQLIYSVIDSVLHQFIAFSTHSIKSVHHHDNPKIVIETTDSIIEIQNHTINQAKNIFQNNLEKILSLIIIDFLKFFSVKSSLLTAEYNANDDLVHLYITKYIKKNRLNIKIQIHR